MRLMNSMDGSLLFDMLSVQITLVPVCIGSITCNKFSATFVFALGLYIARPGDLNTSELELQSARESSATEQSCEPVTVKPSPPTLATADRDEMPGL